MQPGQPIRHFFCAPARIFLFSIFFVCSAGAKAESASATDNALSHSVGPCQSRVTALWGLCRIDGSSGPPVVPQTYFFIGEPGDRTESQLFPARMRPGEPFGYLDAAGLWEISPQFKIALPFTEGLAVVSDGIRSAAINASGKPIVNWFEGLLFPFHRGMACAVPGGSIRLGIPGEWRKLISNKADDALFTAPWWRLRGMAGFIDTTGKMVIPAKFEPKLNFLFASCGFNSLGYAVMRMGGKEGLINTKGEWVISPEFEYLGIVFSGNRKLVALVADRRLKKGLFLDTVERLDGSVGPDEKVSWRAAEPPHEIPVAGGLGRTLLNLLLFPRWQQNLLNDEVSNHTLLAWVGSLGVALAATAMYGRRTIQRQTNALFAVAVTVAIAVVTTVVAFLGGILSLYVTVALFMFIIALEWRRDRFLQTRSSKNSHQ